MKTITKDKLQKLIKESTFFKVAENYNIHVQSVRRLMRQYHLSFPKYVQTQETRNKRGKSLREAHIRNPELGKFQTRKLVSRKGKHFEELFGFKKAQKLKLQQRKRLLGTKQSDITKKKRSQSSKGRVFSEATKQLISKTRKQKFLSGELVNSPRAGCGKGGFKSDIGHYIRSSYEYNFAKFLKQNNISYSYESKHFAVIVDKEKSSYTPDFYISKIWFEIKNSYNVKDEFFNKKLKSFKKLYPNEKIYVIIGNSKNINTWVVMKEQEDLVDVVVKLQPLAVVKG